MLLARNGHRVKLWDHDKQHVLALEKDRVNQRYLPGIPLPDNVQPVSDFKTSLADTDFILCAVPSAGFRGVLKQISSLGEPPFKFIWASKGLEPGTGKFLHEVVTEELPESTAIAALSGPSFAAEVAKGLPTAVTIASEDIDYAGIVAKLFHCPSFRAYTSDDLIGVELGGSIKNVLAIAAGISDGLGGKRETFMGLAGVGDLVLTCTDDQSRNRRLGLALGRGVALEKAVSDIGQAVEGLHTAREINAVAERHGVDMPITYQVKRILFENEPAAAAVDALLAREAKPETV